MAPKKTTKLKNYIVFDTGTDDVVHRGDGVSPEACVEAAIEDGYAFIGEAEVVEVASSAIYGIEMRPKVTKV